MKKILLVLTFIASSAFAEGNKLEFAKGDSTKNVLSKLAGKVVELRLKSGEKLGGKVETVGDEAVHLSSLTGQEFYDAVVDLDDVSAVIVRTK